MNQPKPRRTAGSRTSTSRPRKIAGRVEPVEVDEVDASAAEVTPVPKAPKAPRSPRPPKDPAAGPGSVAVLFAGARLTRVLLVALAIMVLVLAGQGIWLETHRDDAPTVKPGEIAVPSDRPVILNQSDVDAGVDQAAKDAIVIFTRHYQRYDDDVAKAVDLMTDEFAAKFKQAAADSKSGYVEKKVNLESKVMNQGVVRANRTQLQALLFLNEWITKGSGKDRRITLSPYRVLVTMVHTNTGWLVDNVDTK